MIKINYFDLGLHKDAKEIDLFLSICEQHNFKYNIYGFEAHPEYCKILEIKYKDDKNIQIINKAISNKNGNEKLYLNTTFGGEGNSIFKTKNNVIKDKFIVVESILFSEWIEANIPNFKNENNILRFNIEGAEWYLMNDLNKNGMLKFFKIFLGSHLDMNKVSELKEKIKEYEDILNQNNIKVESFVNHKNIKNCNLALLINQRFKQ